MRFAEKIAPIAKSLVAGALAGVSAAVPLWGSDGIVGVEWLIVAGAVLAGQQGVYWTPNKDPLGQRQRESVQPPNA